MMKIFKRILRVSGLAVALIALLALVGWWWWLRWPSGEVPEFGGTLAEDSVRHDGLVRSWLEYVPERTASRPALVIVLHGSNGDASDGLRLTHDRFNELADEDGFVVVYPDGYRRYWNGCRASAAYPANREDIDDVGFLRALIAAMEEKHGVDPSRVFVTGISNGGHMAYRMGLEAPEAVAAIAAVVASLPIESNFDCVARGEPVATLIMNGTEDPFNPFGGGLVRLVTDTTRGRVHSTPASALYWARLAGHRGPGTRERLPDRDPDDGTFVTSTTWRAPGRVPVVLITVEGGGHTVPHARNRMPRLVGRVSRDVDAAEVIWEFFAGILSAP